MCMQIPTDRNKFGQKWCDMLKDRSGHLRFPSIKVVEIRSLAYGLCILSCSHSHSRAKSFRGERFRPRLLDWHVLLAETKSFNYTEYLGITSGRAHTLATASIHSIVTRKQSNHLRSAGPSRRYIARLGCGRD
jgi:hypothetical protein